MRVIIVEAEYQYNEIKIFYCESYIIEKNSLTLCFDCCNFERLFIDKGDCETLVFKYDKELLLELVEIENLKNIKDNKNIMDKVIKFEDFEDKLKELYIYYNGKFHLVDSIEFDFEGNGLLYRSSYMMSEKAFTKEEKDKFTESLKGLL